MTSKEELNALKNEIKTLNEKLAKLTDDELEQVIGGFKVSPNDDTSTWRKIVDWLNNMTN